MTDIDIFNFLGKSVAFRACTQTMGFARFLSNSTHPYWRLQHWFHDNISIFILLTHRRIQNVVKHLRSSFLWKTWLIAENGKLFSQKCLDNSVGFEYASALPYLVYNNNKRKQKKETTWVVTRDQFWKYRHTMIIANDCWSADITKYCQG